MFLQVPLPQGCLSHSSTSESKKAPCTLRVGGGGALGGKSLESERLTDTHGLVPRLFEAVGADAAVAPQGVDALSRVTNARVLHAFVTI